MSELTVATRYAKSIIDLTQEQNVFEAVKSDMDLFLQTLKTSTELQAVLRNPIISHYKKKKILEELFAAKVNKVTMSFFDIMVNKGRAELLYSTAEEFINQYDAKKHITKASIVSATPLSAANKQTVITELQNTIGGQIALDVQVNPTLIGGFVLTVGDRQLDTSISSALKNLKKEFAQRAV